MRAHGDDGRDRRARDLRLAGRGGARAALARGGGHHPRGGRVRGARGLRARPVRGARRLHRAGQERRRDRAGRRRAPPGRHLRRGPDRARHGVPGRLPRGGAVAHHAARGARLPRHRLRGPRRRQGGRPARRPPDGRPARAAGHRRRPAAAARDRPRTAAGRVLHGAAALPRAQPGHVPMAHARRPGRRRAVGRAAAGRRGLAGDPRDRRQDRGAAAAAAGGRAPRPRHGGRRRRVRHGRRGRRPRGPGRRGLRRVGGPAHDRDRARGARWPGRHVVADRELPRLPRGRVRGRAGQPRAPAGAQARRRDPRHPDHHPHRRRDAAPAPRRRRRPAGADDHPGQRRRVAAPRDRGVRPARRERHLLRGGAQRGRRTRTAWTCTSWAPATRRGRRPCSSPPTRGA